MATKRISFLARLCFDKKPNSPNTYDVHISAYQIFHNTHHTQLHLKRSTDTYTGRCENMWIILKRNSKCQCHIWTSCWWRFAHFWIGARLNHYQYHLIWEPDATEHPLFLIVNGHHNTMVCFFSLNFQKSNEIYIKWQKSLEFF